MSLSSWALRSLGPEGPKPSTLNPEPLAGLWSTILEYFFLVPVPLRNHYEIKVHTFFSLVTSKPSSSGWLLGIRSLGESGLKPESHRAARP